MRGLLLLAAWVLSASGCQVVPATGTIGSSSSCLSNNVAEVSGIEVGINNSNGARSSIGQSFKTSTTALSITSAQLRLIALESGSTRVTGTVTLTIEGDNAGSPAGNILGFASIDAATVRPVSSSYYTFTFATPISLVAQKTYWLKLDASYSSNPISLIEWAARNDNPYVNGAAAYYNTSSGLNVWSDGLVPNYDFIFQLICAS